LENALRFHAVLFDCDGVLVDSEPITHEVLRNALAEAGWALSEEECYALFLGRAVRDQRERIERETGRPLTDAWMAAFWQRRNAALQERLLPIPHAAVAVAAIHAATQGRIACASGADRVKVELQLRKTGMDMYFAGRVFSGHEMPRSKPWPDVYLAAAAALQADPRRCAVIEDTVTGVASGVGAGATVFAYAPQGQAQMLIDAGATFVFESMAQLPGMLGATLQGT
jgi:HAD superfamily hydrolase (TIGR01509 family)